MNTAKTRELIITLPGKKPLLPPPYPGLERVAEARVLGVVLSSSLGFSFHITNICTRALQSLYAIRILTSHGLEGQRLHDVVQSTTLARLFYASPAWYGFLNAESRNRLNSIIKKLKRRRYLPVNYPSFEDLCDRADGKLFSSVLKNRGHVLSHLLPPVKETPYLLTFATGLGVKYTPRGIFSSVTF